MKQETTTTARPVQSPRSLGSMRRALGWFLGVTGALLAGIAAQGIYSRGQWTNTIQTRTNEAAQAVVQTVRPEKSAGTISLQLPGQTMPYVNAPIYAQTSGYLKAWYFDIGTKVKTGAVLAEIDTPEVDQQLAQAQAQLKVAQAARDLAQVTYQRYQNLFKNKVIAAQDFDTAADNYSGDESMVIVDQAIVNRLQALEAFKIIRAPFDGVVTARNTDIGTYIPAGSGTPLFQLAATSRLRVYVDVPQAFSPFVKVGGQAELALNEFPGQAFPARVVSTAGAINTTAKRLLTELDAPNPTGQLPSGAYVQVTLKIPIDNRGVTIPARTILFHSGKPAVAVVEPNRTIQIRPIKIARDLGTRVQVTEGLTDSDPLIINPSPGLISGMPVTVAKPAQNDSGAQE
jgi:RND family efflux transporter MFP subunit